MASLCCIRLSDHIGLCGSSHSSVSRGREIDYVGVLIHLYQEGEKMVIVIHLYILLTCKMQDMVYCIQ